MGEERELHRVEFPEGRTTSPSAFARLLALHEREMAAAARIVKGDGYRDYSNDAKEHSSRWREVLDKEQLDLPAHVKTPSRLSVMAAYQRLCETAELDAPETATLATEATKCRRE